MRGAELRTSAASRNDRLSSAKAATTAPYKELYYSQVRAILRLPPELCRRTGVALTDCDLRGRCRFRRRDGTRPHGTNSSGAVLLSIEKLPS